MKWASGSQSLGKIADLQTLGNVCEIQQAKGVIVLDGVLTAPWLGASFP